MKTIIALGDSITFGRFDESKGGWVSRLKKYYESKDIFHAVYNLGVPGDNSKRLLQRIDIECSSRARYIWKEDKHLILIAIGINDSRGYESPDNLDVPPEEYEENVLKIISIAKKHTKDVAIIGITPVDESITSPFENTYFTNVRIEEYNDILKTICKKEKILFIDIYNEMKKTNYTKLLADGLHPNSAGYDKMYEIIRMNIERNWKNWQYSTGILI